MNRHVAAHPFHQVRACLAVLLVLPVLLGALPAQAKPEDKVSVAFTVDAAGLVVAPATIGLSADAWAKQQNHPIVLVEFYADTDLVASSSISPYAATWSNVPAGTYSLTAKAINDKGDYAISPPIVVAVDAPPTVALTGPSPRQVVNAPGSLTVSASATDPDGTIARVEFYQGAMLIGTATGAPYVVNWSNVPAGSYSLTAVATDNLGASTASTPVPVVVNALPSVAITAPAAGQKFTAPATIALEVNAADTDGSVVQVAYFQNGNPIGTATTAPFNYTWTAVPPGTYSLTAQATDDLGGQAVSLPVTVTVNAAGPVLGLYSIRITWAHHDSLPISNKTSCGDGMMRNPSAIRRRTKTPVIPAPPSPST